ncbi:MAG TPA: ParB/Srx family N-terminal domain-containing protein [Terriglobales bacterium]|nr:ParB/Srx family N-terminal domain-containing protein [Terriglobales bacterium]
MSTHVQQRLPKIRVADSKAYHWFWSHAPCYWQGKVDLEICLIDFGLLEPAHTLKHWDVLATWTRQIACRRQIPPLIVSRTPHGTYYIHDGNHRVEALRICFRKHLKRLRVRVAVAKPRDGFVFRWQEFSTHSTYQLVPNGCGKLSFPDELGRAGPPESLHLLNFFTLEKELTKKEPTECSSTMDR